jgi:hypothetical protein
MLKFKVELWENSYDFLNHGIPWWEKILWKVINPSLYRRIHKISTEKKSIIRGFYDKFRNRIILCTRDLEMSTVLVMRKEGPLKGDYHKSFGLQMYFTMVHEIIHMMGLAKDDSNEGHTVDKEKLEDLPDQLRDIVDGLLDLKNSNDAFQSWMNKQQEEGDGAKVS